MNLPEGNEGGLVEYVLFWLCLNPYNHMIFEVFGTLFTFIVLL